MEIIKRLVETIFTANDKGLVSSLNKQGEAANEAASKFAGANDRLAELMKTGIQLAAGYASIGYLKGLASSIMDVGQKAEQANISLAGILSGQGMAKDFNAGLDMASKTLAKIEKDAAALPGEAQEFQDAFQTAASAIGTSGMKLESFVEMSNKMVAIGKIFGQDSAQSGRDIALLIEGRAGMDVGLWSKLAPYMGMAVAEGEKFNKLKPEKRMEKLLSVVGKGGDDMGKLGDMIKAYGSTWDAISSTITSTMNTLWRVGTAPLFDKAKANAQKIADWIGKNEGMLKIMAGDVGAKVSEFMTPAAVAGLAGSVLGKVAFGFGPVGMLLTSFGSKALLGGKSLEQLGDWAMGAAEKVGPLLSNAAVALGDIWNKLAPSMERLLGTLGSAALSALEGFVGFLVDNKDFFANTLNALIEALAMAAEKIGGMFKDTGEWFTEKDYQATGVADRWFGAGEHGFMATGMARAWSYLGGSEMPGQNEADIEYGKAMSEQNNSIKDQGKAIAKNTEENRKYIKEALALKKELWNQGVPEDFLVKIAEAAMNAAPGEQTEAYYNMLKNAADARSSWTRDKKMFADPNAELKPPKKPTINQDFRNSRFDIRQQFSEGMDPDRVAVAFRRDIEGIGQRKLQSGITGAIMGMP